MQILPAIDIRNGRCVRLRQGDFDRETIFGDDPVAMAEYWVRQGAERLHLVDLDGAKQGKPVNHDVVKRIVRKVAVPCQAGGGIRDEAAIRMMLEEVDVDRVIVGTQALRRPDWFCDMARAYPSRVALGLDVRESMVATDGWLEVSSVPAFSLVQQYTHIDLAAVIYTNIASDGMMQGVAERTIKDMIRLTELGLKVIASGGVTTADDVKRLADVHREHSGLIGAIIGRALYEETISVADAIASARQ